MSCATFKGKSELRKIITVPSLRESRLPLPKITVDAVPSSSAIEREQSGRAAGAAEKILGKCMKV